MTLPLNASKKIQESLEFLKPLNIYRDLFKFYHNQILFKGGTFDINTKVHLFAAGKAASFELKALKSLIEKSPLNEKLGAMVSYTKEDHFCDDDHMLQLGGTHPLVSEKNLELTDVFVDYISQVSPEDSIIFLLSGGASALLEKPIAGMSFVELQKAHKELLSSGLNINEMNKARKKMSQVKGGGLLDFINTKKILQVITCDIPNEDIFDVSSGPLLKPGVDDNPISILSQSATLLLKKVCEHFGYINKGVVDERLDSYLNSVMSDLPKVGECFVSGGESTIQIPQGAEGLGGRSTHFVLALADLIYKDDNNHNVHILSFGTDGTDGPTDAAGAYINYELYKSLDSDAFLKTFDSYHYFDQLGTLVKTGPTMNNLMDLRFIWRE